MTVGAGVWLGHRQIDATLYGKAGVRLSAFTRASSGAETLRRRSTSFGAVRGSALAGAHSRDVPSLLASWMPFQNNPPRSCSRGSAPTGGWLCKARSLPRWGWGELRLSGAAFERLGEAAH